MTRPVWHFAPGTPGGGLPREDITPKVLEAVLAMNATEDKNGCMYDDGNGQFVSKGDTGFNQPDGDGSSGDKELDTDSQSGILKYKVRSNIRLSKDEYGMVTHELNNNLTEEERLMPMLWKSIGNNKYKIKNNGFNEYLVLSRKRLK